MRASSSSRSTPPLETPSTGCTTPCAQTTPRRWRRRCATAAKQSLLETRDALGYTPLLRAADQANPKILTLLLEAGADLAAADNSGSSALHLAAESGSAESLELLLKAGATRRPGVDVKDRFGVTALALAAMRGHAEAARVLVAYGASPHAEDEDGKTPLSESQGEAEEITAAASAAAAMRHPLGHEGDGRGESAEPRVPRPRAHL